MANGKEGDHPLTDITLWGHTGTFSPDIEGLILELDALSDDYSTFDPFGDELAFLILRAERDRSLWPELYQRLAGRRSELQRG